MSDKARDRDPQPQGLARVCNALGHRVAVAGSSLVALLSLFHHVPISTAVLRGAATYLAIHLVSRFGFAALLQADALDKRARRAKEDSQA